MAISLNCANTYIDANGKTKKCGMMEPYMDSKTEKVFCSTCFSEIPNVSHFTKMTMKSLKQYKQKSTATFCVKCKNCGTDDQPILANNDVVCPSCKKPHTHLTPTFKMMLKQELAKANQDVQ